MIVHHDVFSEQLSCHLDEPAQPFAPALCGPALPITKSPPPPTVLPAPLTLSTSSSSLGTALRGVGATGEGGTSFSPSCTAGAPAGAAPGGVLGTTSAMAAGVQAGRGSSAASCGAARVTWPPETCCCCIAPARGRWAGKEVVSD